MPEFDKIRDSGERQEFETGSKRDTRKGKGRFDLITPWGLKRLAKHYEGGSDKYGDYNWELGQPIMRYLDSAERHINDLKMALRTGEMTEDHASAVVWNMLCWIHMEECLELGYYSKSLDNRPEPYKTEWS